MLDPDDLLNPGVLVRPAAVDADLRGPESIHSPGREQLVGPARPAAAARRGRLRQGGPPLHRRRQVHRRQLRLQRRHVPVLPGDPQREGLDPRPCPGAAGDDRRPAGHGRLPRAGGARGARPVPVVQGLRQRLPDRHRHGHLQVRGAAPVVQGARAPAQPLHPGQAAVLGAAHVADRVARQPGPAHARASARSRAGSRASTSAAACRLRDATASRKIAATAARRAGRPKVVIWADSFTEFFSTDGGTGRAAACSTAAGYDVEVLSRPQCCGLTWITTGQLDTARAMIVASRRAAASVRRGRSADRRARAVVPVGAALGRGRAGRRSAGGRRRGRRVHARRSCCSVPRAGRRRT